MVTECVPAQFVINSLLEDVQHQLPQQKSHMRRVVLKSTLPITLIHPMLLSQRLFQPLTSQRRLDNAGTNVLVFLNVEVAGLLGLTMVQAIQHAIH